MGYGMKYKKGKGFPFKTDLKDLSGTTDKEGEEIDLTKKPSIVATDLRKKEYNQSEEEQEKESDEETERINTTPVTIPPMFSDADAHRKTKSNLDKKKKN